MDVLSSVGKIAGYRAVIEAVHKFQSFLAPQITAAGKYPPAKVLVIGAGVAGLEAVGAAHSLGTDVRAFDTRLETRDQVESMGGKFLEMHLKRTVPVKAATPRPCLRNSSRKRWNCSTSSAKNAILSSQLRQFPDAKRPFY